MRIKNLARSLLGVTLLEILLVLAIAAMIIIMSVRYYQSATASQQANSVLQQFQAITAAADSLSMASGNYTSATNANLYAVMPGQTLNTPWGATINVSGSATSIAVSVSGVPLAVCSLLQVNMKSLGGGYTNVSCASGNFSYNYSPIGATGT